MLKKLLELWLEAKKLENKFKENVKQKRMKIWLNQLRKQKKLKQQPKRRRKMTKKVRKR